MRVHTHAPARPLVSSLCAAQTKARNFRASQSASDDDDLDFTSEEEDATVPTAEEEDATTVPVPEDATTVPTAEEQDAATVPVLEDVISEDEIGGATRKRDEDGDEDGNEDGDVRPGPLPCTAPCPRRHCEVRLFFSAFVCEVSSLFPLHSQAPRESPSKKLRVKLPTEVP